MLLLGFEPLHIRSCNPAESKNHIHKTSIDAVKIQELSKKVNNLHPENILLDEKTLSITNEKYPTKT